MGIYEKNKEKLSRWMKTLIWTLLDRAYIIDEEIIISLLSKLANCMNGNIRSFVSKQLLYFTFHVSFGLELRILTIKNTKTLHYKNFYFNYKILLIQVFNRLIKKLKTSSRMIIQETTYNLFKFQEIESFLQQTIIYIISQSIEEFERKIFIIKNIYGITDKVLFKIFENTLYKSFRNIF